MDPADPPPKKYGLKPREFERIETTLDRSRLFDTEENEIHAILRDNQAKAEEAGLNEIVIKKTSSRRRKDYWTLLLLGNGVIFGSVALAHFSPLSVLFGGVVAFLFFLILTWIMWFVMSKY